MEVPAKRPRCEKCACTLHFPYQTSAVCTPCSRGQDAAQLHCHLCQLQGGEMTQTQDGLWIHTLCGFLAFDIADTFRLEIPQKRRYLGPPDYLQVNLPPTAYTSDCVKCTGQKPAYAMSCSICKRQVHFACFLKGNEWNYSAGFECGCQIVPSAPKVQAPKKTKKAVLTDYEPIRVSAS